MQTTGEAPSGSLEEIVRDLASATVGGHGPEAAVLRIRLAEVLRAGSGAAVEPNWPVTSAADLPAVPGVYVVSSTLVDEHYVGLALDLRDRFHNDKYGHLAPRNKSRAARLIESGHYRVQVPHVLENDSTLKGMLQLARLEIHTYATLVLAGRCVINSFAMLGRVGETVGTPVIVCDCTSGTYAFADSIAAASRLVGSRGLMAVVYSYERTARGHAARWATLAERDLLGDSVGARGVLVGGPVKAAVEQEARDVTWTGSGRNGTFRWRTGPLSGEDRERLARYRRARYVRRASLVYRAVGWSTRNKGWQCRAKTGLMARDLWRSGKRRWSELDAAIAREERIRAERWEPFNVGRYASNADAINAALGTKRFAPW